MKVLVACMECLTILIVEKFMVNIQQGKNKTWEDSRSVAKTRSKTFPGVAKAMAEQWG